MEALRLMLTLLLAVIEVELIRRLIVKRRVRPSLVVERKVFLQPALCIADTVVGVQITPPRI